LAGISWLAHADNVAGPAPHSSADGAGAPDDETEITPEMVQAVAAILCDWDRDELVLPEWGQENFYDALARHLIRRLLAGVFGERLERKLHALKL
jgi:hypothetical protein